MTAKRLCTVISAILLTVVLLGEGAEKTYAVSYLVNAIGAYNGNPWGTKADIETANPQIRDGAYSWARATVQYNQGSTNYYAEIGWFKDGSGIHVHVTSQSSGGHFDLNYSQQPAVGSRHNYSALWNSSLNGYDLKYDGTLITNRPASLVLTRVFSGGEAYSSADAIGISGCLNNQYASTSGGGWLSFPSHYDQVTSGYWVTDISANSWQVGGNN